MHIGPLLSKRMTLDDLTSIVVREIERRSHVKGSSTNLSTSIASSGSERVSKHFLEAVQYCEDVALALSKALSAYQSVRLTSSKGAIECSYRSKKVAELRVEVYGNVFVVKAQFVLEWMSFAYTVDIPDETIPVGVHTFEYSNSTERPANKHTSVDIGSPKKCLESSMITFASSIGQILGAALKDDDTDRQARTS
jgi:hypothetical protein